PIGIIPLKDLATFGGNCSGILISSRSICVKRYSNSATNNTIIIATNNPSAPKYDICNTLPYYSVEIATGYIMKKTAIDVIPDNVESPPKVFIKLLATKYAIIIAKILFVPSTTLTNNC